MRDLIWRWRALIAVASVSFLLATVLVRILPQVTTVDVLVAKTELSAGTVLSGSDLQVKQVAKVSVTDHHLKKPAQALDKRVALNIPAGVAILDSMLVGSDQLGSQVDGKTVLSMRLRPEDAHLVYPGANVMFYLSAPTDLDAKQVETKSDSSANPGNDETEDSSFAQAVRAKVLSFTDGEDGLVTTDYPSVLVAVENSQASRLISANTGEPLQLAVLY